jgi:hypothetical protein
MVITESRMKLISRSPAPRNRISNPRPRPGREIALGTLRSPTVSLGMPLLRCTSLSEHLWDPLGLVLARSTPLAKPWVSPTSPLLLWVSCVKG